MPVIEARDLSKFYHSHRGIDQLNLKVCEGEIFGFLGPNGAGKTTTIRLMFNFIRPSRGSLLVLGKSPRSAGSDIRRRIGYLPGELGLYEDTSGDSNLRYLAGLSRSQAPLRSWLCDELQLTAADLKRRVKSYSKGMKQKLGIVQAIQHDPELIIMDEPTGGLDPLIQVRFFEILRELRKRGKTVFFSTHVLSEIARVCDRVGVVLDGKLVLASPVSDLLAQAERYLWIKLAPSADHHVGTPPPVSAATFQRQEGEWLVYKTSPDDAERILAYLGHLRPQDFRFECALEESFLRLYDRKSGGSGVFR